SAQRRPPGNVRAGTRASTAAPPPRARTRTGGCSARPPARTASTAAEVRPYPCPALNQLRPGKQAAVQVCNMRRICGAPDAQRGTIETRPRLYAWHGSELAKANGELGRWKSGPSSPSAYFRGTFVPVARLACASAAFLRARRSSRDQALPDGESTDDSRARAVMPGPHRNCNGE